MISLFSIVPRRFCLPAGGEDRCGTSGMLKISLTGPGFGGHHRERPAVAAGMTSIGVRQRGTIALTPSWSGLSLQDAHISETTVRSDACPTAGGVPIGVKIAGRWHGR